MLLLNQWRGGERVQSCKLLIAILSFVTSYPAFARGWDEISSIRSMGRRRLDDLAAQFDARTHARHAVVKFLQRVHLHELAFVHRHWARTGMNRLPGIPAQAVNHARFGGDEKGGAGLFLQ